VLIQADARRIPLADESVNCVVTSPPYWGLRDYGTATWEGGEAACDHLGPPVPMGQSCSKCGARRIDAQTGLEATPEEYVASMVAVFREVRRVLKPEGTLWVNMGDGYTSGDRATYRSGISDNKGHLVQNDQPRPSTPAGLKPKDLVGMPWRLAFALQADGWWLRSDIIWAKPNPMPESVTDRPTKAHEYIFLLSKSERYWYDADAVKERSQAGPRRCGKNSRSYVDRDPEHISKQDGRSRRHAGFNERYDLENPSPYRNLRTVWTIATQPYQGAHYATFPEDIPRRCILAGCPPEGIVLDPFVGSGTVVRVARSLGRQGIGLDVNRDYLREQAAKRIVVTRGLAFQNTE